MIHPERRNSTEEILRQHAMIENEAQEVRDKDKVIVRGLLGNFYNNHLNVGIGFQQAYGSILSGDYFELVKLPDNNYLFVFADISGHGLPAYTTLIRLRSVITLVARDAAEKYEESGIIDPEEIVRAIGKKFTDVMDDSHSNDFASVIFTFIKNEGDKFHLQFFNRGMFFPIVVRKFQNNPIDIYDLNLEEKGWYPKKGYLLSSEIRKLMEDKYEHYPSCTFTIYEGDCILYFSDGIIEAQRKDAPHDEYGMERMKNILLSNIYSFPQGIVNILFDDVYEFIGDHRYQSDDMTAVLIDFPLVR